MACSIALSARSHCVLECMLSVAVIDSSKPIVTVESLL